MRKNKRGISPLIATVLLIGFTVALAAMVMTWGSGFIKKTTEQTTVDDKTEVLEAFGAKTYSGFKPNPNVNKVEAIATVDGGEGNEDIICSQVVEEFTVECPETAPAA